MRKSIKGLIAATAITVAMLPMTVFAQGKIAMCTVAGDNVHITAAMGAPEASSDNNYYLVGVKPYDDFKDGDVLGSAAKASHLLLSADLEKDSENCHLYDRFYVAVKTNGGYKPVSEEAYITNPQAIAAYATELPQSPSKKGFTGDLAALNALADLGGSQVLFDLNATMFFYPGQMVDYAYNGKIFQFNQATILQYDMIVNALSAGGRELTMQVVNDLVPGLEWMVPAKGRVNGYRHYGYNVGEQGPMENIAALFHFLSERYANNGTGTVTNWIIGNEVNNNNPWHFVGNMGVDGFTTEYEKEFRVIYNAIKSGNANARVLTCVDQRWTWEDGTASQYGVKYFLDSFNAKVASHGNIDWGLAAHPHPLPLTCPRFWNIPSNYKALNLLSDDATTKMITPINLNVLTNYLAQESFRTDAGQVRYLSLSEMLFNSSNNSVPASESLQAAGLAYAYKIANENPVVKCFIIHRLIDHDYEVKNDGISCGLLNLDGSPKPAYIVAKYIDTPDAGKYANQFLAAEGLPTY